MGIIRSILLTLFCVRLALSSLENIKVLYRGYYCTWPRGDTKFQVLKNTSQVSIANE